MADVFITDIKQTSKIDDSFEFVGDNGAKTYSIPASVLKKYTNKGLVNPNLLDNWYFGNPVNQRGLTEYTGAVYGIDRLKSTNSRGILTVMDDCVHIKATSDGNAYFRHTLEKELKGVVTFSALVRGTTSGSTFYLTRNGSNAGLTQKIFSISNETTLISQTVNADDVELKPNQISISVLANEEYDLIAWKLEYGDTQTLAHQDANGNWVLNEIPNYAEQLARCQRYYQYFPYMCVALNQWSFYQGYMNFIVPMRTSPAVTLYSYANKAAGHLTDVNDSQDIEGATVNNNSAKGFRAQASSGLVAGHIYYFYVEAVADL